MTRKPSYESLKKRVDELEEGYRELLNAKGGDTESKKEFRSVLDEIEDAYIEMDLKGNPIRVNRAFYEIIGYPPDLDVSEIDLPKHHDKETIRKIQKAYNQVLKTEAPYRGYAHEMTRVDGTKRILEHYISLKKDSKGLPAGFRTVFRDITELERARVELSKHRSHLEAIFSSVKDAIITVDTEMTIIEANRATNAVCGLPRKKVMGKTFFDSFNHCQGLCHDLLKKTLDGQTSIQEHRITCRNYRNLQQSIIATALPLLDHSGKSMGAVLVLRDITRLSDLESKLNERQQFHRMIGKSKNMQGIYALMEDLSDLETTVLVTGESGTGKELVADALHYSGTRKGKPLVKVNCSALAENLLESELFGHVKGAFTGAVRDREGRFQAAHGGTIMLDEIGDISPTIQLKLLRVLQEKEFERVGESVSIHVDVRVIACTNRDLKEMVMKGEFREDLYYRLRVIEIVLPPLRERTEDVPLLVDHFCKKFSNQYNKEIEGVSDEVLRKFMNYSWPGNIRELEHAIERAFVLCRERIIQPQHIPLDIKENTGATKTVGVSPKGVRNLTRQDILDALDKTRWNKAEAARLLGVGRRTLYRKFSKYGIS